MDELLEKIIKSAKECERLADENYQESMKLIKDPSWMIK